MGQFWRPTCAFLAPTVDICHPKIQSNSSFFPGHRDDRGRPRGVRDGGAAAGLDGRGHAAQDAQQAQGDPELRGIPLVAAHA